LERWKEGREEKIGNQWGIRPNSFVWFQEGKRMERNWREKNKNKNSLGL
jgi:hypothetical protein